MGMPPAGTVEAPEELDELEELEELEEELEELELDELLLGIGREGGCPWLPDEGD
jgi:hypothetical protein